MAEPHPTITFEVKLDLNSTEAIGPNTNLVNPHMLHPSMHQDSPDLGRTQESNFKNTRSTWLSSLIPGGGIRQLKDGNQFTVSGQKAIYLRNQYVSGTWNNNNPPGGDLLEIVS